MFGKKRKSVDRKELESVKKRLTKLERKTTYLETQIKVIRREPI